MVSSGSPGVPGSLPGVAGARPGAVGVPGSGPSVGPRRRTLRSARRVKSGPRRACGGRRRPGAAWPGKLGKAEGPAAGLRGRAGRRPGPAGGEDRQGQARGARAVTSCGPSPLPGSAAAGPDAGRRGGLACRPGPQASTLDSARPVKSAAHRPGLTPGPQPRVDTGRCPPRLEDGPVPGEGRYREGGTGARTATVRAPVGPALGRRPGTGTPGCARRVALSEGSVIGRSLAPPGFPSTTEIGFLGPFFAGHQEKGAGEAKKCDCYRRSVYFRWPFMYLACPCRLPGRERCRSAPLCTWRERPAAGAAGRGHARREGRSYAQTARPGRHPLPSRPRRSHGRYAALGAASALVPGPPAASGAAASGAAAASASW
jgi:hypothetical protein